MLHIETPLTATFLGEYLAISVFFAIALVIGLIALALPKIVNYKHKNLTPDKLKSYECGFDPFDDARGRFDISFYLIAILFIIFDLEVTFLIPWAIVLKKIGVAGFWSMMFFLFVLTAGFIYEWKKGALNWE